MRKPIHIHKSHHLDKRADRLLEKPQAMGDPTDRLDTKAEADWLEMAPATLEIMRSRGYGPPYERVGNGRGRIRYPRGDTTQWLKERRTVPAQVRTIANGGLRADLMELALEQLALPPPAPKAPQDIKPNRFVRRSPVPPPKPARGQPTEEQRAEAREILMNIRMRRNIAAGRTPIGGFKRGERKP